jgi:hypothetical protein
MTWKAAVNAAGMISGRVHRRAPITEAEVPHR